MTEVVITLPSSEPFRTLRDRARALAKAGHLKEGDTLAVHPVVWDMVLYDIIDTRTKSAEIVVDQWLVVEDWQVEEGSLQVRPQGWKITVPEAVKDEKQRTIRDFVKLAALLHPGMAYTLSLYDLDPEQRPRLDMFEMMTAVNAAVSNRPRPDLEEKLDAQEAYRTPDVRLEGYLTEMGLPHYRAFDANRVTVQRPSEPAWPTYPIQDPDDA